MNDRELHLINLLAATRGSVKTDLNRYERLTMVKTAMKEPRDVYEAEAQRLFDLLEAIDAAIAASTKEQS